MTVEPDMTCVLASLIPGGYEWLIVLAIVLLLFGNRIPGMARNLGSGIVEFKKGLKEPAEKLSEAGESSGSKSGDSAGSESGSEATAKGDG